MAFPPIRTCLVCDDFRMEVGGKSLVIGLYGVIPDVVITVKAFDRPIDRLAFVFFQGPGDGGQFKLRADLIEPKGSSVFETKPEMEVNCEVNTPSMLALILSLVKITVPGQYRLTLAVNGDQVYNAAFGIRAEPTHVAS